MLYIIDRNNDDNKTRLPYTLDKESMRYTF